jgi:hypothetical protein
LSAVELALVAASLLIGLTGAWSPCGFSMVETIGPTGHTGGRPTTWAALATFVPGALVGGVLTFTALALLGDLVHGEGGRLAYGVAAVIALVAAIAEARGTPIVPQIRRQLPEHWRRVMPMPLAACLYGILLGLGFTTFVLSFGVWALAGISFAVGDPALGVGIGLAFGAGRAIPVLALAPVCDRPSGIRATELMTQRPALYRGFRAGDAATLALAAVLMTVAAPAGAAERAAAGAGDPVASGSDLVFTKLGQGAVLRRDRRDRSLPGTDPAIGGPYIAVRQGGNILVLGRQNLARLASVPASGADALAISRFWLVYRTRAGGTDTIEARRIGGVSGGVRPGIAFGPAQALAKTDAPGELSRPSLYRSTLVYARSTLRGSSVIQRALGTGKRSRLIASHQWLLSAPSVLGRSFAYVRTTNDRQQLRLRRMAKHGKGHVIYAIAATSHRDPDHDPGHNRLPTRIPKPDLRRSPWTLWTTALAPGKAYVTLLGHRGGHQRARIIRVGH